MYLIFDILKTMYNYYKKVMKEIYNICLKILMHASNFKKFYKYLIFIVKFR